MKPSVPSVDAAMDGSREVQPERFRCGSTHHLACDCQQAIADDIKRALVELVRLKGLKDRAHGMNCKSRGAPGRERAALLNEYRSRKDAAWEAARVALSSRVAARTSSESSQIDSRDGTSDVSRSNPDA